MSIRVLQISRCKKRKPFGCRHTRVRWAAERGHLSFDTEENLLNAVGSSVWLALSAADVWQLAFSLVICAFAPWGDFDFVFQHAEQRLR